MRIGSGLGTAHGLFDRRNGVSPPPFDSLNLSYGVGDSNNNVSRNRRRIRQLFPITRLVSARQVHSDKIYKADTIHEDMEVQGFDALLTNRPGIGLLIQQADCQAILLHDPVHKAIAAIHCGWRGSVLNIIAKTIKRMSDEYRSDPDDLRALISPSLGPCCAEFKNYRRELPAGFHPMRSKTNYFDFWKISAAQLSAAGVPERHIETCKICTACNNSFFSYRRSRRTGSGTTGRQGSIILLEP